MKLYILKAGQVLGPYSPDDVRRQLSDGTISAMDRYAAEGELAWRSLAEFAAPPSPALAPPSAAHPVLPASAPFPRADPHLMPASAPDSTSGLAIGALVSGILGLICCGLSAIVAVILGHLALREIKQSPLLKGREMALIGLILGYVVLGLILLGLILAIFSNVFFALFSNQFPVNFHPPH